jgi:hypothetical protein
MWPFERFTTSHLRAELSNTLGMLLDASQSAPSSDAVVYQLCVHGFTPCLVTEGSHYLNYWLQQHPPVVSQRKTIQTLHILYHKGLDKFIYVADYAKLLEAIDATWQSQQNNLPLSNLPLYETWHQLLEKLIHMDNKPFSADALAHVVHQLRGLRHVVLCNPANIPLKSLSPWWHVLEKQVFSSSASPEAQTVLNYTLYFDTPDTFRIRHQHAEVQSILKTLRGSCGDTSPDTQQWLCSSTYMQALLKEHWHALCATDKVSTKQHPELHILQFYEPFPQPLGVRHTPQLEHAVKIGVLHHPAWGKEGTTQLDTLFTQISPQRVYEDMPFHLYRLSHRPFESLTQLAKSLYELQLDIVILWPDTPLGVHLEALAVQASGASLITHAQSGSLAHSILSEELKGKVMLNVEELEQWLAVPDTLRGLRAIQTPQAVEGFQFKPRTLAL